MKKQASSNEQMKVKMMTLIWSKNVDGLDFKTFWTIPKIITKCFTNKIEFFLYQKV